MQSISTAVAVGLGLYTSYALLANGQMQAWGNNQDGQLGIGVSDQSVHGSRADAPGLLLGKQRLRPARRRRRRRSVVGHAGDRAGL
jgi:hypothetical protein